MSKIRVLTVDDSPLLRQMIRDMLNSEPDIEVVGVARDGAEGVQMVRQLQPDVVTLDVEMPRMNGLEALRQIMAIRPTPVVMCSTLTDAGATTTMEALAAGAVDFICKPDNGSVVTIRKIHKDLAEKVRHARHARLIRPSLPKPRTARPILSSMGTTDKVVVIASSTGGPRALATLFQHLPKGFSAPILIVQHMPPGFLGSLAKRLESAGPVPVAEAMEGSIVAPGRALFAPAGKHMRVRADGGLEFTAEPTLHGVRPAADYLFATAAKVFGSRCVGVVLTGMGRDGAEGARAIRQAGGTVLSESEETCTIYGMPRAAVQVGAVHREVRIEEMASAIVDACQGRVLRAS